MSYHAVATAHRGNPLQTFVQDHMSDMYHRGNQLQILCYPMWNLQPLGLTPCNIFGLDHCRHKYVSTHLEARDHNVNILHF